MVRGLGIFSIIFAPLCIYLRGTASEGGTKDDERGILVQSHKPDLTIVNQTTEEYTAIESNSICDNNNIPMYSLYNTQNGVIE